MVTLLAALLAVLLVEGQAKPPCKVPDPVGPEYHYFVDLANWMMTLNVSSNNIHTKFHVPTRSIFINGDLARVLTAAYRLTCNSTYLNEALGWCDTLVKLQNPITSSRHVPAGYWGTGYGAIYLADTGTAVTQLAYCYHMSTNDRQKESFLQTLQLYDEFVQHGCLTPPPGRTQTSDGWVISSGKNAGALGNGYIKQLADPYPYVVSSSTTGGAFFTTMYEITQNPAYREIAQNATKWLLSVRFPNGSMPYIYDNGVRSFEDNKFRVLAYATEPFLAVGLNFMKNDMTTLNSTVTYLLGTQNSDGTWGKLLSANGVRSPRVFSLLQYYNQFVSKTSPDTQPAMKKFLAYFLNPQNSKKYDIKLDPIATGFVGLAYADWLGPWVTWPSSLHM